MTTGNFNEQTVNAESEAQALPPSAGDLQASFANNAKIHEKVFDISEIKMLAGNFLFSLAACHSMRMSQVEFVKNRVSELFGTVIDKIKLLVESLASKHNCVTPLNTSSVLNQLDR